MTCSLCGADLVDSNGECPACLQTDLENEKTAHAIASVPRPVEESETVARGGAPLGRVADSGLEEKHPPAHGSPLQDVPTLPDQIASVPDELPQEDEESVLSTGAWRVIGSGLGADVVLKDTRIASRGLRARRVGDDVELIAAGSGVQVTVDGVPHTGGLVSLRDQEVEVDGVPLRDELLPHDTMDAGDLGDFSAPLLIGRGAGCDYVIADERVSSRHAGLSRQDGFLLLEDLDSVNGTFVDDRRIKRMRISWRQEFQIGGKTLTPIDVYAAARGEELATKTAMFRPQEAMNIADVLDDVGGGSERLSPSLAGVAPSSLVTLAPGDVVIVGRDIELPVVFDTPNVSRRHARIRRTASELVIEDLGSTNGTWVNGDRIQTPRKISGVDDVRIGHQKLQITRGLSIEQPVAGGGATGIRIDAESLVREVGSGGARRRVIDDINFSILPGEMVALMGPSGAGKTSLLTTIAGYTPPTTGQLFMDGMSLYSHFGLFREAVGYVPQEDVMHRTLTVEEVLYYQAKLNFPAEVTRDEIDARIDLVLAQLDLQDVRQSVVGDEVRRGLSGGQRKRLNVAMELMSEPAALLLDEPTSGLDARSAMQLIRQCRGLATSGRTVIMTIHQPRREAFDLFDKLLLLSKGGKLAYFGPAKDARPYFTARTEVDPKTASNPADFVLDVLDPVDASLSRPPEEWGRDFEASPLYTRFIQSRMSEDDRRIEADASVHTGGRKANFLRQLGILSARYAVLKGRDVSALGVQLIQAPVIAGIALLLFYQGRFAPLFLQDDVTPTLFVLIASAVWFGCSNVAREIVGERAVFRRERMGRLRPGPYLLSKLGIQSGLIAVQVGLMLGVLVPFVPLEGGILPLFGVAMLAGFSSMSVGLLVSTIARSELQAIQLVPLVILPQVMLSGILLPVAGENASLIARWMSGPVLMRWGYASALHVEFAESTARGGKALGVGGADYWGRVGFPEPGAEFLLGSPLMGELCVMGGLGLVAALATWVLLARRDRR